MHVAAAVLVTNSLLSDRAYTYTGDDCRDIGQLVGVTEAARNDSHGCGGGGGVEKIELGRLPVECLGLLVVMSSSCLLLTFQNQHPTLAIFIEFISATPYCLVARHYLSVVTVRYWL